jgi:hypothetical protein
MKHAADIPTPEEQHARAKEQAKREAEKRTQEKAREMQEMIDRQAPPAKKEK